jgi:hypothetical protein
MNKLTVGDFINWAEPNQVGSHDSCVQCGRKTGKNPYRVHVSTGGAILHPASDADGGIVSQGFWAVGSECAKKFDLTMLIRN